MCCNLFPSIMPERRPRSISQLLIRSPDVFAHFGISPLKKIQTFKPMVTAIRQPQSYEPSWTGRRSKEVNHLGRYATKLMQLIWLV